MVVLSGAIQADLFDLGPYPAVAAGGNWVLGELWQFHSSDMDETLRVLDRIEGYEEFGGGNEYNREVVSVEYESDAGTSNQQAFAYFAADPVVLRLARKIEPNIDFLGRPMAAWPDSKSRVPASFSEE